MSDEDSDTEKRVVIEPIPEHEIWFTEMPDSLVEKAILILNRNPKSPVYNIFQLFLVNFVSVIEYNLSENQHYQLFN